MAKTQMPAHVIEDANVTQTSTPQAHLANALRNARKGFVLAGVFSAFLNLLMLTTPIYMLQVFDRVLTTGHSDTLIALTVIVAIALAVLGVLEAVRLLLLSRTATWINASLGPKVLSASLARSLGNQPGGGQGMRDLGSLQAFLGSTNLNPFFDAPWTPVFVFFIFLLHPWLGVLALVSAIMLFVIAVLNDRTSRPAMSAASTMQMTAMTQSDEAVRNAEVIQAMGMQERITQRWHDQTSEAALEQDGGTQWMALFLGLSRFLRFGAQAGVLGVGAALVITGDMTPGGMIAGSILLGRALAPVDQAIGAWRAFVGAREAHGRLTALFDETPLSAEGMSLPPPKGQLTLENASFLHPNTEQPAIDQASLQALPGTITALIGPSASGKSTLCRMLVGAWRPTSGHVRLDGAEISEWPRGEVGQHIGYLPQDIELFSGSIRSNISRMTEADAEVVVEAAEAAGVHQMVLRLPQAYDTPVGPQGAQLSGGQRQRIGLARALFGNPQLIVLDEPNANLDTAGEAALAQALTDAKARGATILISTHKRQLLSLADNVAMLDAGQLRAFGPRDEVFAALEQHGIIRSSKTASAVADRTNVTQLPRGDDA